MVRALRPKLAATGVLRPGACARNRRGQPGRPPAAHRPGRGLWDRTTAPPAGPGLPDRPARRLGRRSRDGGGCRTTPPDRRRGGGRRAPAVPHQVGPAAGQHHLLPPLGRPATRPCRGPTGAGPRRAPAAHRPGRDRLVATVLRARPRPGPVPHPSQVGRHARRRRAAGPPPLAGAGGVGGGGGGRGRTRVSAGSRSPVVGRLLITIYGWSTRPSD